jgi:hypothetical protein
MEIKDQMPVNITACSEVNTPKKNRLWCFGLWQIAVTRVITSV